jgi:hypothetical protein
MDNLRSPTDAWEARILVANIIGRLRRLSFHLSDEARIPSGFLAHLDAMSNHLDRTMDLLPPEAPTPSAEGHPSSTS